MAIFGNSALMPSPFSGGLNLWSRTNGTAGTPTWAAQPNAAVVPADEDFGSCLEILKQSATTSLRYMRRTRLQPGTYLRISTRVKAIAGNLPRLRIAGYAMTSSGAAISGVTQIGPEVSLTAYGEIVEISAIVGSGSREGVDMPWGRTAAYGHFGLDLLGDNNGAVRIENFTIEDVTTAFLPQMLDWVDVRDYGAVGNGVTDDRAAFVAADAAAAGGEILVPEGLYRIGSNLSISAPVRFKGRLTMPRTARLALQGRFDFPTYASAFGDETEGFKRALQALFGYTDHTTLDLCGRRVDLTEPIDLAAVAPGLGSFSNRRLISNGQIGVVDGPAWATRVVTSAGTYDPTKPLILSNVTNIANIEIGSRISGGGVGREVYVRETNVGARTITLSQPMYGGAATRNFTFQRYRYALDFSGLSRLDRLNIADVEFQLDGVASAILLPANGQMFHLRDCYITRPKDRGITSIGNGCQDMLVDRCQFLSNEMSDLSQDRTTIAINVNGNDSKIRHNRFVRFGHFMVANGGGHIIEGNHWFQGDSAQAGVRFAGLVLTRTNVQTTVTGNYIDNSTIEWTNEHAALPNFGSDEYSFGGLTITGNTFLASNTTLGFAWLTLKPYGTGHFIHGLSVMGNVFKSINNKINRIDRVDTTFADLNYGRMRNLQFQGNMFNGVNTYVANPVDLTLQQNTAATRWVMEAGAALPFNGWAQKVESVIAESAITTVGNARVTEMPWVQSLVGTNNRSIALNWSVAVKGTVSVRVRVDTPN